MATKKNIVKFTEKKDRGITLIKLGGKEYKIRKNEYFINKATKIINSISELEEFEALDAVFEALSALYGRDVVEEIAENNEDIDWGEFLTFSITMALGADEEGYKKIKAEMHNEDSDLKKNQ